MSCSLRPSTCKTVTIAVVLYHYYIIFHILFIGCSPSFELFDQLNRTDYCRQCVKPAHTCYALPSQEVSALALFKWFKKPQRDKARSLSIVYGEQGRKHPASGMEDSKLDTDRPVYLAPGILHSNILRNCNEILRILFFCLSTSICSTIVKR